MIRMPVKDVRTIGRATQGVTLFKVAKDEKVVSVAWLVEDDDEDDIVEGEEIAASTSEQAVDEIQQETDETAENG